MNWAGSILLENHVCEGDYHYLTSSLITRLEKNTFLATLPVYGELRSCLQHRNSENFQRSKLQKYYFVMEVLTHPKHTSSPMRQIIRTQSALREHSPFLTDNSIRYRTNEKRNCFKESKFSSVSKMTRSSISFYVRGQAKREIVLTKFLRSFYRKNHSSGKTRRHLENRFSYVFL